jgi:hypothetical protein
MRPIGVLSLDDIARYAIERPFEKGLQHVVETLAAVCQPRQLEPRARKGAPVSAQE